MSSNEFADRLRIAVARHIGAPGTIHDLQRLTGGANKTTWSFDADVPTRERFILQTTSIAVTDASDGLAAGYVTERVDGETLATRILRDDRYANARKLMTKQCGEILAT